MSVIISAHCPERAGSAWALTDLDVSGHLSLTSQAGKALEVRRIVSTTAGLFEVFFIYYPVHSVLVGSL